MFVTLCARMIPRASAAAAALLVLMLVSAAPAQDSMQLDLQFKESLSRGGMSPDDAKGFALGRPRGVNSAQGRVRDGRLGHHPSSLSRRSPRH
jgi:hypothetical protein